MPTVAEEALWLATNVKDKKFDTVQAVIEANPDEDLVNTPHAASGRSYIMYMLQICSMSAMKEKKPYDLLNYLINHPKVNWALKKASSTDTVVGVLLDAITVDPKLLPYIINVPAVLFNGAELSYQTVAKSLALFERNNSRDVAAGKVVDLTRTNSLKTLLSAIRDLTILHAIKMDDDVLFQALKEAGARPTSFLGDLGNSVLPSTLIKDSNVKLNGWYAEQRKLASESLAASSASFFTNIEQLEKAKAAAEALSKAKAAKDAEILAKAASEREERMETAFASVKM